MLKHVISTKDFKLHDIENFVDATEEFTSDKHRMLEGHPKILATLFFEPSTRTRLSLESAMIRLGGHTIGENENTSSAKKGETVYDTIRTVEGYADVIAIRHPIDGTARLAAFATKLGTPIINAGDGANQHITQMLTDVYTIYKKRRRLDSLKIGYMGDLKYGRTVHSLVEALSLFNNIEHHFIVPDESLQIEAHHVECLKINKRLFAKHVSSQNIIEDLDVLYVTRLQRERFPDPLEYNRIMKAYRLTPQSFQKIKKDFMIMHPMPRNEEIHPSVDDLPCAHYFEQAHNGVAVRKNILYQLITNGGLS